MTVLLPILVAFAMAALLAWLIIHTREFHLHFTADHPQSGPQKRHTEVTPRIGGLAVMAGLLAGLGAMAMSGNAEAWHAQWRALPLGWLLLALLPLFVLGLFEDVSQTLSVRLRLGLSLVSAVLAWWVADVRITVLGLPLVDGLLQGWPWASMLVSAVAVAGLVHAMNIVDGLNGLLAGISAVVLGVLALVCARYGELALAMLSLVTLGAIAGFAVFNFPRGRLFCGDGGAYLIGFICAAVVILLVRRQPVVSPWFALAVLMHPVTETLYSAWRRARQGLRATEPDAQHLHSLWSEALALRVAQGGQAPWLGVNAGASWRTVLLAALPSLAALPCPEWQVGLQLICAAYGVGFIVVVSRLQRQLAWQKEQASPPMSLEP